MRHGSNASREPRAECDKVRAMRTEDGEGGILLHYVNNSCYDSVSWKHKDPGCSEEESISLGAAKALGKAAVNTCISMNQTLLLGAVGRGQGDS